MPFHRRRRRKKLPDVSVPSLTLRQGAVGDARFRYIPREEKQVAVREHVRGPPVPKLRRRTLAPTEMRRIGLVLSEQALSRPVRRREIDVDSITPFHLQSIGKALRDRERALVLRPATFRETEATKLAESFGRDARLGTRLRKMEVGRAEAFPAGNKVVVREPAEDAPKGSIVIAGERLDPETIERLRRRRKGR